VVCGTLEAINHVLVSHGWQNNTGFVERHNLDVRQHVAAIDRRVTTFCKGEVSLQQPLALFHTTKPHETSFSIFRVFDIAHRYIYMLYYTRMFIYIRMGPGGDRLCSRHYDRLRSLFGSRVIFPCWGSVQQNSPIWTAKAYFEVLRKQCLIFSSGKPLSGPLSIY